MRQQRPSFPLKDHQRLFVGFPTEYSRQRNSDGFTAVLQPNHVRRRNDKGISKEKRRVGQNAFAGRVQLHVMTKLDDVLAELHTLLREENRPVANAPELAERLDQSRRKTLDDLRLLERNGDVESFEAGANALVWWPTDILGAVPSAAPVKDNEGEVVAELAETDAETLDPTVSDSLDGGADE